MAKGHFGAFLVGEDQVGGCLFWGDAPDRGSINTSDWFFFSDPPKTVVGVFYEVADDETMQIKRGVYTIQLPQRWTVGRWQRASISLTPITG